MEYMHTYAHITQTHIYTHTYYHINTHIHIYMYIRMYMCVIASHLFLSFLNLEMPISTHLYT